MEYNKNRFQKTNDKKVLHKVKKQWVVLSMSLLAAIGGGALASHVTTHADTTNNNNQTHVQASTLKGRLNQNLIQSRQSSQNQAQAQAPKTNSQAITQKANVLHNRIVNNTVTQHLNQSQVKMNVNPNQGNVLQKRIDANAAQMGGAAATGSVANFVDNEFANNNDQPSVVGSISASSGTTYGDLASNVPTGYLLDALAPGTNMNTPVTFTSKSADIEVSKKENNSLTANNLPYEIDYNNSNGQPQQTYSAGSAVSASSTGIYQPGWNASVGSSLGVSAGNASAFFGFTLPSGYQMSGGSYTATMTPTGIQWTDNTGKVVASPKFTAVPKTSASAITVHLIDHSGYQVPLTGTTGITSAANAGYSATLSNGDLVFNGTGDFGNTIDALPSAINQNLPSGYSLASSQYSDYTFGSTAQTVNAMVNAPKASNASVNIKLMNYNHEGSGSQSVSSSYKLQDLVNSGKASVNDSDVKEGDIVTINPGTFASSGYNATGSDYTNYEDDRVYVGDNGDVYQASLNSAGGTAPSTSESNPITFNYSENDTTASSGDLPTVTVTYVNQNGSTVTSSSSANIKTSDYGKTIDLTQPSENGVPVPGGYQLNYSLDDNDATKFTVNNNGTYHKTLYVIGDNVTTNGTKDGNGQRQNHSLGTYTLPITIQKKTSDSANATTDDTINGTGIFSPQITGRVGDSMIISPSDFLDDGQLESKDSKLTTDNYGLYSGDHQYRITFGTSGNLKIGQINPTDPGNSKSDSTISGNPVFTYVGNENGANKSTSKKHAIRVNYLYQDMNYVNGQTPSQKWIQIPNTTVSDYGSDNSQYKNQNAIKENIPKGYQFVKILNVNPTAQEEGRSYHNGDNVNAYDATAHGTSESTLNNTVKDLKFGNSDQAINIAVIPTAGDVTVEYYNQNGQALNSDGNISDNPSKDIISGNSSSTNKVGAYSRYGQTIDLAHGNKPMDSQGVSYGLKSIPAGYHLVQNPMTDPSDGYQFTRQPQTIKLTVVGNNVTQNSSNNKVTVNVQKVPGNGQTDNDSVSDTTYAHGRVGNPTYLDPNDYAPAGYHADPSDHPFEVDFTPNGQAQHNNAPINSGNRPNWKYVANTPSQSPFYFNVTYVNEKNGQPVSNKDRVNGYYGENISDVTQYAGVPLGYTVDESNNAGKPYSYKLGFGKAAQNGGNVDVPVEGIGAGQSNVGNLKFTVYSVYKSKNGQERISDQTKTLNDWHSYNHNINANGTSIGDTFTVKPSDYKPSGEEYSVDKADVPETVQVLPNGNGATLSTDQAVFYYDDNHSGSKDEAAPIVVHYINKDNGHQVGTNDVINGKYKSKAININNGVIANASDPDANWSVPDGYTASDAADSGNYSFGSDIQNVYLPVEGKQVSDNLTVYQIKEDQSDTQLGDAVAHSKTLSGKVGDTFTISPYSDVPRNDKYSQNGYHADNSDDDVNVTLGTDGHILLNGIDHRTNNNSYGISYVYRPNVSSKTDDTLDTITIHYKDASNPNGNDIDTEYDHSTTGKPFDITPYENDIPSNVSNNYYYYDAADTNNTSKNPGININSFKDGSETNSNGGQPNNQDVTIFVKKNDGTTNDPSSSNGSTTGGPSSDPNSDPNNQY